MQELARLTEVLLSPQTKPIAGIRKKYWTAGIVSDKEEQFHSQRAKKRDRVIFRSHGKGKIVCPLTLLLAQTNFRVEKEIKE